MPGIVGIINKKKRPSNDADLHIMLNSMMHERFYNRGIYVNDQLGIHVGWICQDKSFSDCHPIFNEKKDLLLFFSGENFADSELFERLRKQGHEFDSSNASTLIHLYEEEGEAFLKQLNGWFSGLLIDTRKAKALLFNDRYGIQRIYYRESKDEFLFSSEAKALLQIRPQLRNIDYKGLAEYLSCGCVLENRTLFSDIYLLPGGAVWIFEDATCIKKGSYFYPRDWENQPILGQEIFYNRLKETFQNILPRYFVSNQPIGMSLTGGLDTRMIMAGIKRPPNSLPCYTFGSMYRESLDVRISRKVANASHQSHQVLKLDNVFLANFSKHTEQSIYISDGLLDACSSYELYLNRLARDIAPIRMTGNYGSEVLRNVRAFKAAPLCNELLTSDFKPYIQRAVETFAQCSRGNRLSFSIFKQAPWNGHGRLAVEQSQVTLRTPFMDNDFVALVYQAHEQSTTISGISISLIQDYNSILSRIPTDRGLLTIGAPYSIFARLYFELLIRSEYYYNHGMPHWLAKLDTVLSPMHLEKFVLGHNKFHHYRTWFRQDLASYVHTIFTDRRTKSRPYLNVSFLQAMLSDHIHGRGNYTNEINMVMTIELMQRLLIDN